MSVSFACKSRSDIEGGWSLHGLQGNEFRSTRRRPERQGSGKAAPIRYAARSDHRCRRNGIHDGRYERHCRHCSPNMAARFPALGNNDIDAAVHSSFASAAEPTVCSTIAPPAFARGTRKEGSRQNRYHGTPSSRQAARRSS